MEKMNSMWVSILWIIHDKFARLRQYEAFYLKVYMLTYILTSMQLTFIKLISKFGERLAERFPWHSWESVQSMVAMKALANDWKLWLKKSSMVSWLLCSLGMEAWTGGTEKSPLFETGYGPTWPTSGINSTDQQFTVKDACNTAKSISESIGDYELWGWQAS